jgi:DnaK suppressor protein
MPDILDHAKDVEMRQRQAALDKVLKHKEPAQDIQAGVVICIDCTTPIEIARLSAKPNAARCIQCQTIEEKRHGR